ncbi:hypothetical protein GWG65_35880 [Bradyrhizobium sp. CSA207]|uniref:hypothetical protein n=1 Tax=Bradyrhizobium sp. CSA207 TaxID=2698826 RepID=UPI0023AF3ECB|nr:hypothetical protein [Bradyrhizobium sp. CSA207]MDE5446647.1 hypothetical protein [Bradyrhizobium sp. CSA207]
MIRQRARSGHEGVIDTLFHRAEERMQVKFDAYLPQRRWMASRPFSQVTSASVLHGSRAKCYTIFNINTGAVSVPL